MKRMHSILTWFILFLVPIYCYSEEKNQVNLHWSKIFSLPMSPEYANAPAITGAFGGISNNTLFVAGGTDSPALVSENESKYIDDIFILELHGDLDSLQWIKGNKLDRPVAYGASVTTPLGVLCMGGKDDKEAFDRVFLLSWDRGLKELSRIDLPPLPQPCAHGCATISGNHVYLAGGQSGPGLRSAMKNFWRLDLSPLINGAIDQVAWEELAPWPGPERTLNITVAQHDGQTDCIYVISGCHLKDHSPTTGYDFLTDVYKFSPNPLTEDDNKWQRQQDIPVCIVEGTAAALGQSHIFVLGASIDSLNDIGEQPDIYSRLHYETWAFDTITDTWIKWGPAPVSQTTTPIMNWDGKFIIPGIDIHQSGDSTDIWLIQPEQESTEFGIFNFSTLISYLLAMLLIGFYFARYNKDTDDYFRGGQRIPWWAAACSIFATMLSSITYMSVPAKAYAANWEYLLGYPAIFITAAIVVYFVLPFFRRIDATSAYEYLEKRFNRLTRQVGSGMFILFQIGRMAIVMYLSALALSAITPFSEVEAILIMGLLSVIYSTLGGVEAVIWTDTIQTFVLLGGALLILIFALINIDGGLTSFFTTASEYGKFHMVNWNWDLNSYATAAFWVLILGSLAQNLISYTSDQAVVQRYMTTSSEKLARHSIWTNGILSLCAGLLFFVIGAALFVFYKTHPTHLDPTFKNDAIMPLFIVRELPIGIAGLLVAGIFAAAQSTISTSMNSAASAVVVDFLRLFVKEKTERYYLNFSRFFNFCIGLAGTLIAVSLASADIKSLLDQFFAFIGLFGGSLGGLFLLGMFTKRATGRGAFTGAIIGAIVLYLVQSYTDTHVYLYAFVGVTACFIGGYVSSLILGGAKSDISGLTVYDLYRK
ncbi:sodium/solute symporter [candidate division KSB1 bacterium]|nr:sodium/solute symporter [candidate division KSB1 bacterium]